MAASSSSVGDERVWGREGDIGGACSAPVCAHGIRVTRRALPRVVPQGQGEAESTKKSGVGGCCWEEEVEGRKGTKRSFVLI